MRFTMYILYIYIYTIYPIFFSALTLSRNATIRQAFAAAQPMENI